MKQKKDAENSFVQGISFFYGHYMTLTIFHVKLKSCTHAIRENLNDLREKLTTQKVFFDRKKTTCQA